MDRKRVEGRYQVVSETNGGYYLDIEYTNDNGERVKAGFRFIGWVKPPAAVRLPVRTEESERSGPP